MRLIQLCIYITVIGMVIPDGNCHLLGPHYVLSARINASPQSMQLPSFMRRIQVRVELFA